MYYRRKLLVALLQQFDDGVDKIRLQKLLFLFSQGQANASFHFVPYKYGCFSFQANADLGTMAKIGIIEENENRWCKRDPSDYSHQIKPEDNKRLKLIISHFGKLSTDDLVKFTYQKFPFFAINSVMAPTLLIDADYEKVKAAKPINKETKLFTIGYEGSSLESYLNKLIKNSINVLCDVRRNPLSMKYGFSKSQLQKACDGVGISYIHIPEVGIDSELRQNLSSQEDYDRLFTRYKNECLRTTQNQQQQILTLLETHNRVALTCFEADICQCHRKHLAEAITQLDGFTYSLQHI